MEETRVQKSERRRKETLQQFHETWEKFCDTELKTGKDYGETLVNAIHKMDLYVQGLVKQKPQEKTFYTSVALEWQRIKLAQIEEIKRRRAEKEKQAEVQTEVKDDGQT